MRIAVIATFCHPTRLQIKERTIMQSAAPELIAALCPDHAEVEIYNEKVVEIPLDKHWDLVFFSYLHSYYEHTKVLSTLFRQRGMKTVAGGRHATYFSRDCQQYFDAVVTGEPEANVPSLIKDFERGEMKATYNLPPVSMDEIKPYRYDLIDFSHNRVRMPGVEASRGCPFTCNFCVMVDESYRYRPIKSVINEIQFKMRWNEHYFGLLRDSFMFLDNNLGGSRRYLRELCEALIPLKKTWGCALTFNILRDEDTVKLMAEAGCRYIYTGLESLNPESLKSMNKAQNKVREVDLIIRRCFANGLLLSFGFIVGSDGDTNEYLERLPHYLADLQHFSITFLGIMCPYPETPLFRTLKDEGRLLPGTISRDYDCYTLCHRPQFLHPSEVADHYQRLCLAVANLPNVVRHYWTTLWASNRPRYKLTILGSGPEITSLRNNIQNKQRRYIAGLDPLEEWDRLKMDTLKIVPQYLS